MGNDSRTLEILLKVRDEASKGLSQVNSKLEDLQPAFKKMAVVGVAGLTAIGGALGYSVKQSIEAESALNRLTQILRTSRGATDSQIASLVKQAEALEKVGVVSKDNIISAQSQLATFDLSTDAIERLTPAILDYVVAEKGAGATTDDLKSLTNGLAQALQGNFASLTKTGFVLDEATKELIANGTETERATALVSVLDSTYKGFNETARSTTEGGLIVMRNEFNNLAQTIGETFAPIITQLVQTVTPYIQQMAVWIEENPKLTKIILLTVTALFALVAVLGTLGLILPPIIAFFGLLSAPVLIIIAILGALVFAVVQVVKIFQMLHDDGALIWEGIKLYVKEAIDSIIQWFTDAWNKILNIVNKIKSAVSSVGGAMKSVGGKIGGAISGAVSKVGSVLGINDGVIAPNGQLVSTAPDDWLIATKNPAGLAGGGGVVINLNGTFMSPRESMRAITEEMADELKRRLRL